MNSTETLNAILEADRQAAELLDEAERLRLHQQERIELGKRAIAEKYAAEENALLLSAQAREAKRADDEICRMERQAAEQLAALRGQFEHSRRSYADKVFDLVTGDDNEK
ncbi:MAG: hypothetical protein RR314_06220 [Oscillospiraceae bacterium]